MGTVASMMGVFLSMGIAERSELQQIHWTITSLSPTQVAPLHTRTQGPYSDQMSVEHRE